MGWILKTPQPKRSRNKGTSVQSPTGGRRLVLFLLKLTATAGFVAATMVGWRYTENYLWKYAGANGTYPKPVRLIGADQLDRLVRRQLRERAASRLVGDELGHEELRRVASSLENHPWVEHIHRVERVRDGVVVTAAFRQPVTVVAHAHGYFRVDASGVLLPGMFLANQLEALRLPAVVGARAGPPPDGQKWPGSDVSGALALVQCLVGQPFADQIRTIDVRDLDRTGRPRLVLYTRWPHDMDQGGMIRWGLPPGQGQPIEPDTQTKLRRLGKVHQKWNSIDADGKIVDIYGPAIFVRHRPQSNGVRAGYP